MTAERRPIAQQELDLQYPKPARTGIEAWSQSISLGLILVLMLVMSGTDALALQMVLVAGVMVVAAVLCWIAAKHSSNERMRRGWNWFALSMLFYAPYFLSSISNGEAIATSITDPAGYGRVFKLVAYACSVVGLGFAVQAPRRVLFRILFDTGVVLTGVAVIFGMAIERSSIEVSGSDLTNPMLYRPLIDVTILSLTLMALSSLPRSARLYRPLIYGALALISLFVGHIGASIAALRLSTAPPEWVYLCYALAGWFVGFAAWRYIRGETDSQDAGPVTLGAHNPLTHSFWFHLGNAVVPYTIAMTAATLLVIRSVDADAGSLRAQLAAAGAVAFVVAGALRHILNHAENRDLYVNLTLLNRDLEGLVEQRTTELVRRNEELEAVHQVALVSATSLDLARILQAVAEQLTQAVDASRCLIFEQLSNGEPATLIASYQRDDDEPGLRRTLPPGTLHDLRRKIFEPAGYRTSLLERSGLDPDSRAAQILDFYGAGMAMMVPLVAGEQTIGIAEVYRAQPEPFNEHEVSLAEAIATQGALATENARVYDKARFAANHDPVTGLLNHRALHDELSRLFDRAVQRGAPLTVFMMDLNLFKEFNDRYGHQAGDRVLADIGQAIKQSMPTTAVVARYGGDEFTVGIPDSPRENAQIFTSAIRERVDAVQEKYGFVGEGFGVSIGVASYPEDGTELAEILATADQEMYQDKWRLKGFVDRRRMAVPERIDLVAEPVNAVGEPKL